MSELIVQGETAEELITKMRAHGFTVTKSELARWHRADLLGRPVRRGQGRGHGMVSIYPTGTAEQLQALCEIHQTERRLPHVAWHLWWAGYDVPMHYAQFFLDQTAAMWQQGLREVQNLLANPEALVGFFSRAQVMRLPRKTLAGVRKRVGRKNFPTFIDIVLRVASGTFEGFAIDAQTGTDERERSIVEMGFGLRRARTDWMRGAEPWLTGDIAPFLKDLSHRLRDHPLGEDIKTVEDSDLKAARDEVRDFLSFMEQISALLDNMFGRGAFGYTPLAETIREFGPQDQAFMILFWRMLRAWGWDTNMDQLLQLARLWHLIVRPMIQGIEQLRVEVPDTAEHLAPKQMGVALRRKAAWEGTIYALRQLSQRPEVKAFFEHHPELSQLADAYEKQQQINSIDGAQTE